MVCKYFLIIWFLLTGLSIAFVAYELMTILKSEHLKIVIEGHLERRRESKIKGRGNYRDPVQSSKDYTVIS